MLIQRKIAEYCLLRASQLINEQLYVANRLILMAKYCLANNFEMAHYHNLYSDFPLINKWMADWYLETIKQELQ